MQLSFSKYQGAGNDFILLNHFKESLLRREDRVLIARLCDRHFGIGADGLIWLEPDEQADFRMVYFNADGGEGSMCGNGARCAAHFAYAQGIAPAEMQFNAYDGLHEARVSGGKVDLEMRPVTGIRPQGDHAFELNTGSPHYVDFQVNIGDLDIVALGRARRYSPEYAAEGINVNFVEVTEQGLKLATYERGVEDETLACGTGVTAAALAFAYREELYGERRIAVQAKGGDLSVQFTHGEPGHFGSIRLIGPAKAVFQGLIEIPA